MNITKVELLWSRSCPFTCAGCRMPNNLRHDGVAETGHCGSLEMWKKGIDKIRALGAEFIAIYGAEPLDRMEHLAEVIDHIRSLGMATTVITALPNSNRMKLLLETSTLDSVTVSYDALNDAHKDEYSDAHRRTKSKAGWSLFANNNQIRDKAVVATITADNVRHIPEMARRATERGYWFMFDVLHGDLGPLGKCGRGDGVRPPSENDLKEVMGELIALKQKGLKIHTSTEYLTKMQETYTGNPRDFWHCKGESTGWLTVDADGSIMPCDDWQKRYPHAKIWDEFDSADLSEWKQKAVTDCEGCAWNTHWDACAIERGDIPVGSYIHD
jgi:MoaA/NifB/PqqE/SkfB family radical SAM enzyme